MQDGTIVSFDDIKSTLDANSANSTTNELYKPTIDESALVNPEPKVEEPKGEEPKQEDWEKKFKDTQAAYTKARQEIAALKTKAAALESEIQKSGYTVSEDVAQELEELKYSDPEAWRQRLNHIEAERAKSIDSKIAEEVESEVRRQQLEEYNAANPEYKINDYVALNVLPGSFLQRLENGEISFQGFLAEAGAYLRKIKIGPGSSPNAGQGQIINNVDGGSTPQGAPGNVDISYKDAIF